MLITICVYARDFSVYIDYLLCKKCDYFSKYIQASEAVTKVNEL